MSPAAAHYRLTAMRTRFLPASARKLARDRLHAAHAPRLASSLRRLRGLYVKAGQLVASHGLMVPRPYLEACEGLRGGAAAEGTGRVAAVVERELQARGGRSARLPAPPDPGTMWQSAREGGRDKGALRRARLGAHFVSLTRALSLRARLPLGCVLFLLTPRLAALHAQAKMSSVFAWFDHGACGAAATGQVRVVLTLRSLALALPRGPQGQSPPTSLSRVWPSLPWPRPGPAPPIPPSKLGGVTRARTRV